VKYTSSATASVCSAPVHVELALHSCKAVLESGGRLGASRWGGEVRPGLGDGVIDVQRGPCCARRDGEGSRAGLEAQLRVSQDTFKFLAGSLLA
jgi:hypothetical protein